MKRLLLLSTLTLAGCTHPPPDDPPPPATRFRPAGVVRIVNPQQRYLVFESLHSFLPDTRLTVYASGKPTGRIRVLAPRERGFFAADLLDGTAKPGDIVE